MSDQPVATTPTPASSPAPAVPAGDSGNAVAQATATQAPAATTPADDQKSPLDVLEEILSESKAPVDAPSPDPAQVEADKAAEAARAEQEARAQVEVEMERHRQEDQAKLQQEISNLGTIKDTPAYQARVSQDEEKKKQAEATAAAGQGYDIVQLSHTKI